MKNINPTLLELAKEEAINLRLTAKESELKKLNFEELNPEHTHYCIYGQLTGDCYSQRAAELLRACAVPYASVVATQFETPEENKSWKGRSTWGIHDEVYYSPIECLIMQYDEDVNKQLIDYLKGETEELW